MPQKKPNKRNEDRIGVWDKNDLDKIEVQL